MGSPKSGGGGDTNPVIGYKYYMGAHLVVCQQADALLALSADKKLFWTGRAMDSALTINKPTLFGGSKKEGGIVGTFDILSGQETQAPNAYLQTQLGTAISFRGVVSAVLRRMYLAAMSPTLRPWAFLMERMPRGFDGTYRQIGPDANPAHIIVECLTNTEWGMGTPLSLIDEVSFKAAARTLFDEAFGLSMVWSQRDSIQEFIQDVLRHIDGIIHINPRTGKWQIRLMRKLASTTDLPLLTPANVLRITRLSRTQWAECVNQITVTYTELGEAGPVDKTLTAVNLAGVNIQGGIVSEAKRYPGITRGELASLVLSRDLRQASHPIAMLSLEANRTASGLMPGDAFRLSWPEYGITDQVYRVTQVDLGDLKSRVVKIEAVEDIFETDTAIIAAPAPSEWVDPIQPPRPVTYGRLLELPHYVFETYVTQGNIGTESLYARDGGLVGVLASRPSADTYDFSISTNTSGTWQSQGVGQFCAVGTITAPLSRTATSVPYTEISSPERFTGLTLALVDDEIMTITRGTPGTLTLGRGMLDTLPTEHSAWSTVYVINDYGGILYHDYGPSALPALRILPRTGMGILDVTQATPQSIAIQSRRIRPYPPGNLRINGTYLGDNIGTASPLTVAWAHRDRLTQNTWPPYNQTTGNLGPETGTTYTLRLYDETNTLRRTYTGLTGTSQTWDTEALDSGLTGRLNTTVRLELESWRDGWKCLYSWTHGVTRL